nr:hypothetical protein CFP56_21150 [Quercus suber]
MDRGALHSKPSPRKISGAPEISSWNNHAVSAGRGVASAACWLLRDRVCYTTPPLGKGLGVLRKGELGPAVVILAPRES